jgi:glycosyltransferase involved in cell wall biosynthesis
MSIYKNDVAEYFSEALQSIYDNQTKKPDEVVIVIDGPVANNILLVVDDFNIKHPNISKIIKLDENVGLGDALRIGVEHCSGDYILRMDADDISKATRFEKQMLFLEKYDYVDVLGTYIEEFNEVPGDMRIIRKCPEKNDHILKMAKHRNPMNHGSVCIKRESLMSVNSYKPLAFLEDYYLWVRMLCAGMKFANIPESLVYFRTGTSFYRKRSSKERIKGWKVIQDFLLSNKMATNFDVIINLLSIRLFVATPVIAKKFIYKHLLRRRNDN